MCDSIEREERRKTHSMLLHVRYYDDNTTSELINKKSMSTYPSPPYLSVLGADALYFFVRRRAVRANDTATPAMAAD